MEKNKSNGLVRLGAACIAVAVFVAWVLLSGCATGMPGSGDTKLREYMYEGIKLTVEAGAQNVTQ